MRTTTNVLSLGPEEWTDAVRHALAPTDKNGFWGVNNVWDLCALPQPVSVDVAVFHHSFARNGLRDAAEYIRRRWPDAVILVDGEQVEQLDDPLYDDTTKSGISLEQLVWMIEESAAAKKRMRRNMRSGLINARV